MLCSSTTVLPVKIMMPFSSRERDGQFLPMHEIAADGVAPAHVAPRVAEGVVLEEEVVFAFEVDEAVGIVGPVAGRGEMVLRAEGLVAGCRGGEEEEPDREFQDAAF